MRSRLMDGFIAGILGAVLLIIIMYLMQLVGFSGEPGFVGNYEAVFGPEAVGAHLLGATLFALFGGLWGMLFNALVIEPNPLKGFIFGFLPTLFTWVVVAPITGKPLFNGLTPQGVLLPLLFNMVLWGSFVGWYCARQPSTA